MHNLKMVTAGSIGIWIFSVVMIFIFPRVRYPALSTVLAILFWISLIFTILFTYLLIKNIQRIKKQKLRKKNRPLTSPYDERRSKSPDSENTDIESSTKGQDYSEVEK